MIKDETENPRHLPRVSMRGSWFSRRVHPEGLEPSTNGLRGHCFIEGDIMFVSRKFVSRNRGFTNSGAIH